MKACRVCGRLYADSSSFCQADGAELVSVSQVPQPSSDSDPRVGQIVVDRYLVFRVVADGGMGRVYEALDKHLNRHVALKILHPDVAADGVSVERFKREYEVSKQLPHQHIVEVVDFQATSDGSFVLAMEFLVGEELRATLKREKALRPARAIRMLSQLALGLDLAHQQRLIHRDLKPDNIFLCQTSAGDIAKVLDFGSVKDKNESAKQLTVMGTTIGSPFYMAPEQAQGLETLDQRADVWGMAAIFYECITGTVPFQGANGPSILLQILTAEPTPPSQLSAEHPVPEAVDRALARAFKKSAAIRTATVGELANDVGHAYGLQGDHHDWALMAEQRLAAEIKQDQTDREKAPESGPAQPRTGLDEFFGEQDALGKEPLEAGHVDGARNQTHPIDSEATGGAQTTPPSQQPALGNGDGSAPAIPAPGGDSDMHIPTTAIAWVPLLVGVLLVLGLVVALIAL